MFIWEEDSQGMGSLMRGTTRATPLHPPAPKQCKHVEGTAVHVGTVGEKKTKQQNLLSPKYRAERFPN